MAVERERQSTGGVRSGDRGWQTQMMQEALNHRRVLDQNDQPEALPLEMGRNGPAVRLIC